MAEIPADRRQRSLTPTAHVTRATGEATRRLDESPRVLVVEHEAECPPGLWGAWLTEAGLRLHIVRPYLGEPLPEDVRPFDGLLVLGGSPGPLDDDHFPWLPATRALLRTAIEYGTPTFGICLGAELMTAGLGGRTARREVPQVGVYELKVLPAAADDPVFAGLPEVPPAMLWHLEEMAALPPEAVLLIGGTDSPHQAFRIGDRAWGTQFHPEATPGIVAQWARDSAVLGMTGAGAYEIVEQLAAAQAEAARAWRPVARRWAALVRRRHREPLPPS
ncbi:type 1 glutamine amidotransferase [Streptomyces sp. NPDC055287]